MLVVILPLRHLFRTKRFVAAVLRMWSGFVAWAIFVSAVMPIGIFLFVTHDDSPFWVFPDGRAVIGMLLIGWVHAIVICAVASVIRVIWRRVRALTRADVG